MEENRKKGTFLKILAVILAVAAVAALVIFAVKKIQKLVNNAKTSGKWAHDDKVYIDVTPMDTPDEIPHSYNDFGTTAAELEMRISGKE